MTMFDPNRREQFLKDKITNYLGRKSTPRSLGSHAQVEEMASLVRCLMRFAPKHDYEGWWRKFEDRLDEDAKTRAWPTAGEIKAAARVTTGSPSRRIAKGGEIDPMDLNARRMIAGEAMSEDYLYGCLAVELLERGKVNEDLMNSHRSVLIRSLKETYGEASALAMIAKLEARHAAAQAGKHEPAKPRDLSKPQPKMMTRYEWDVML